MMQQMWAKREGKKEGGRVSSESHAQKATRARPNGPLVPEPGLCQLNMAGMVMESSQKSQRHLVLMRVNYVRSVTLDRTEEVISNVSVSVTVRYEVQVFLDIRS